MRAFAEKTFALNVSEDGKFTARDILEGLRARTRNPIRRAEIDAELAVPPLSPALIYLWQAFLRLSARRGSNGFAVSPISWPDIDAFVRHSGMRLAPWEVRVIEDLDNLYRAELNKRTGK